MTEMAEGEGVGGGIAAIESTGTYNGEFRHR